MLERCLFFNTLAYYYDGLGKLSKVQEAGKKANLVQLQYDDNENLIAEIDGNRNTKQLNYDQQTRITGVSHRDKAGNVLAETRVGYDEANLDRFGNPLFKVTVTQKGDAQNRITNYYFDQFERLTKQGRFNDGQEEFSTFQYDYLGNQTKAVNFAGEKGIFTYDALGRLLTATDAAGNVTTNRYDRLGNLICQKDPLGHAVYFTYDQLGRKINEKAPFETNSYSESKYYYDGVGNLVKTVDPEGYTTKYHFNERNQLAAVEQVISADQSDITQVEYDKEGNTVKIKKGLNAWTDTDFVANAYQYDTLNRLVESTDGGERKSSYQYDNSGNLIKTVDRNQIGTYYTYDGLNRLVAKENSKDGRKTKIQFTFDQLGQNRQIVDASGKTIFDYDDLGRLTSVNYGNGIRQKYRYDQADRVTNLQVRQGGLTQMDLQYVYDGIGRLKTVNDQGKQFGYSYDAAGKLVQEQNGVTGIKSDYRYYPSGNIKSMRHSLANETVSFYEYQYDKRGNQVQKNEGVGTTQYYYDALSRVKTVLQPDSSILNYEYDDLNNIKEMAEINGTKISRTAYTYDADSRLLLQETDNGSEMTQQRFTYDGEGNQLSKEEAVKRNGALVSSADSKFWWNGFNQVERVQDSNGQFIDYTYNGLGLRTKKDFGDQAINYFYDQGNIIMEADQKLMVTAKNIRGKKLIHRETDNQLMYYLHNAHGDVTQLTDEFGKVIKDYRYDPFGQDDSLLMPGFGSNAAQTVWQQEVEKIDNPFQYCGEYLDNETGNYYLRARYYDPGAQRFVSEDPKEGKINNPISLNLYLYCGNNPVMFIDPSGLSQIVANTVSQGGSISWNNQTKQATITDKNGNKIVYTVGQKSCRIENGHVVIGTGPITNGSKISAGSGGVPHSINNDKIFYGEFKGPKAEIKNGILNANLLSLNAGMGDSMVPTKYGQVGAKGPSAQVDAGLTLDPMNPLKSSVGVYANTALASLQGQEEFSVPFSSKTIVIKGTADFITIGGGVAINFANGEFKRFKFGGDLGIGGSIEVYFK